jgi:hypothetical protein
MEELKPCPFCEGTDLKAGGGWVMCLGCYAEGPYVDAETKGEERNAKAIELWNQRGSVC